ncbi:non-hydrolyzing UDP-N-acetylglucosamine 2-epimerase [Pseudomonas sp. AD21]|uniref:non-hydrolyzing UDP-N-acetylglucosamine 2-epimerase n=1 Tax=Pseudomonas sp. AD21 TaxID=396378 RepID=UPI000C84DE46|nr:UDP-N-acetylglucosamine 2-epimerase (non-hydrolyzing) [Pseudomonas sp. AD21]
MLSLPRKKILCVIGTRPEAIKMAPIILTLKEQEWVEVRVLATAQHRDMLDQTLADFSIIPDVDLNIMQPNQSLSTLTGRLLLEVEKVLLAEKPDAVLAQGDTTTVLTASLASFYAGIPFGHVEAGLRTGDIYSPFPEEANRVMTGMLAHWHFAPTSRAVENLLAERTPANRVFLTGNTVIDALHYTAKKNQPLSVCLDSSKRMILVTAHRRENFGNPFLEICTAIKKLAVNNRNVEILFPVHPNPNISSVAYELLGNIANLHLIKPLGYQQFVAAMKRAYFIISDSGGVQEEAPALGKPVLVLRESSERPEAISAGCSRLVGTDVELIVREAEKLLNIPDEYKKMAIGASPYGDGLSASRIVGVLKEYFR